MRGKEAELKGRKKCGKGEDSTGYSLFSLALK